MLTPKRMDQSQLANFLSSGEPTTLEYFKENVKEGFANTSLGVTMDYVKETMAGAPEERASAKQAQENINAFYEGRKAKVVDPSSPQATNFTLEDWKKSPYYREGIAFQDGFSESRAKYLAEGYDERKEREFLLQRGRESKSTMFGSGLAGQFIGGLPDPINFIPFGGAAGKGAKLGEKLIRATVEGAAGNLAVSGITRPYWEERGTDSDWQDYVNDVFIGGGMGAGFGLLGHAFSRVRERRAGATVRERAPMANAADQAIEAMVDGRDFDPVSVPGLEGAKNSIFDVDGVKHSELVVVAEQELHAIGVTPEDAQTSLPPLLAHVKMISDRLNIPFDEAWEKYGATFQAAEFDGKNIKPVAAESRKLDELLHSEILSMGEEIKFAEKGGQRIFDEGQFAGTSGEGTFPAWYADAGIKNKDHFFKVLESKEGPVYERLKGIAEDRLRNGYESRVHGQVEPAREFLELTDGSEPMFQRKQTPTQKARLEGEFSRIEGLSYPDSISPIKLDGIEVTPDQAGLASSVKGSIPSEVKNMVSGETISINDRTLRKLHKTLFVDFPASKKSPYVTDLHHTTAMKLKELVETSIPFEKTGDRKNRIKDWEYYYNFIEINGERRAVQIQVEAGKIKEVHHFKVGVDERRARTVENTTEFARASDTTLSDLEREINRSIGVNKHFQGVATAERGAITFRDQGKAVISLFKSADRSTILHETGHLFLNNLERLSKIDPSFKSDLDRAYSFLGLNPGSKIQRQHHEMFAEGFEQFLREGRSPRPELDSVFARYKSWLIDIYKSLTSFENLKSEISDDARELYSSLLGGDARRLKEVPVIPVVEPKAPVQDPGAVPEHTIAELEALSVAHPGLISAEEVAGFNGVMDEIDGESRALDELATFFQGAKDDKALQEAAARAGISKTQFEKIIDEFNQKLQSEDEARLGLEQLIKERKAALEAEAKELRRQAFLAGEARAKNITHVENVINAGGTAKQSILTILEGDSSLRGVEGAGNSVDGSYVSLAQSTSSKCFSELRKIDARIERLFEDDIQFNQNVAKEMIKPGSSGDDVARQAAEVLSRTSEELRQRSNLAGAKIGKLEGHVPRTHDVEKMIGKEAEWVDFMFENLDRERSFKGLGEKETRAALKETFRSLITGEHGVKPEIDTAIPVRRPPRNIAKKMGESRTLHFKGPEVEVAYLKQFGQGDNILQSMSAHFEGMSRKIALMERLGPNPESTVAFLVDKLRKDIDEKRIFKDLDDAATVEMLNDLGTSASLTSRDSDIGHAMMQALGEVSDTQGWFKNASRIIRAVNSLSKLASALLSQPTDFVHAVNERRLLSEDNLAKIWVDTFKDYLSSPNAELREVLDHVGLFVDAINYKNFNRFDADNVNMKLARANDWMFRWSGQNWHVKHSKNAAAISIARELGANISKKWKDVHPGLKQALIQYGSMNQAKWEMLQLAKSLDVDGKAYYHPGLLAEIPDETFAKGLDSKLSPEAREAAIKRERFKLEMDLKTFFVEEGRNAAPEPDAKVRRVMAFGTKAGTKTNEAVKLLTQFKTFAFVNYDRSIKGRRMMKDGRDYGGLAHHAAATLMLGMVSTMLKDLAKGIEPADPSEAKTWMRAAFQSGGLGIMGDFVQAGISSRSGADALTTLMGPTFSTVGNFVNLAGKSVREPFKKPGERDLANLTSDWVDLGRSMAPAPFSTLWYTRAAMDYLVWHQIKETLDPGSISRSQRRLKKEYNQKYLMNPKKVYNL